MDKRLERYLQTVASELGALEAEQRASELREMRQHIEAIVARLVEGGLSENEAVDAAIAQFGAARQVGRELQTASVQNESPVRVAAAMLAVVVFWISGGSMSPLLIYAAQDAPGTMSWLIPILLGTLTSWTAGAFAGFIAPKRGGSAALWTFGTGGLYHVFLSFAEIQAVTPWDYLSLLINLVTLAAQLAIMRLGANFGARHTQQRNSAQA